jgi:hypothetical protein
MRPQSTFRQRREHPAKSVAVLSHTAPVVLILAATAASGPLRRGAGPPPAALIFTNESLDQATVYIVAPGRDFRAGRTDTLTVPTDLATRGTLNIVARSDLPQTGPVSIRPGEQYEVRLPPNSRLMSFLPAGS